MSVINGTVISSEELHSKFKCVPADVELFDSADLQSSMKGVVDAEFKDDDASAFMERSLLYILSHTVDTKQSLLKAAVAFPVSTEADPGATSIAYQGWTMYGQAKAIADYANDFPRADVYGEEKSRGVVAFGTSYGWSIDEIRRAALAARLGRNPRLNERRAQAARRASDEIVDTTAWAGNAKKKIPGFVDYPGITKVTNPHGVIGTITPDEVIDVISALFNGVAVTTNGREIPNALILPLQKFNALRRIRLTDTGVSVLSYIRENFPELTYIDWIQELAGAGAGGTDRAMMYVRDPMNLELHMPLPFTAYMAQQKGLEWVVPCEVKTAGVIVYYELSVAYMDGI